MNFNLLHVDAWEPGTNNRKTSGRSSVKLRKLPRTHVSGNSWLTVAIVLIVHLSLDSFVSRVSGESVEFILPTSWTTNNGSCTGDGLETWDECKAKANETWSGVVNDKEKRDCCGSWDAFNCWSNQVKVVCSEADLSLLEQSRLRLSNQTKCLKYYDISVCTSKPLPTWANILILATGATLITGAAIFVYWRWIRLI